MLNRSCVPLAAERRVEVVEPHVPRVAGAPRLNDDQPGREAAVLDRVRIRHHRHRIDRVVGQREVDQAEHRIGERARADLHAGLRRPAAFDADAARHFDDAREQAQRAAQAAAAVICLVSADRFGRADSVSAAETIATGAITSTVCVTVASGRWRSRVGPRVRGDPDSAWRTRNPRATRSGCTCLPAASGNGSGRRLPRGQTRLPG